MARFAACLVVLTGLLGCASNGGDLPAKASKTARLQVAMWNGFEANAPALPPQRTVLVVDASNAMTRRTQDGVSHMQAGRVAAARFVENLTTSVPLEVFVVAGERVASCDAVNLESLLGERKEIARNLGRLRARGRASVAATLLALADSARELDRVVVVTNLFGECGDDLCNAAAAMADRGTHLDVVAIGDIVAPACLSTRHEADVEGMPVPWTSERPPRFHMETAGEDSVILNWGLVNDIPVEVRADELQIVVDLAPPLRVTRRFEPGSRWKLEVLDFPSLEPAERQWRWRQVDGAEAPAEFSE